MKIAEFLREDLILPDLAQSEKPAVLAELCTALGRAAIPHGKLAGIPGLLATFGRSRKGVDFAAIDGKPTFLFFVLFAPENSAGIHLKALARISRLFKSAQFRKSIMDAGGAPEIFRLIADEDAKY